MADGAREWCDEIVRRFPDQPTGVYCGLALLAWLDTPGTGADPVNRAWSLVEPLRGQDGRDDTVNRFDVMVASVLARAGLADSANAVITRARGRAGEDPSAVDTWR
jgi:hypothetical protein